MHPLEVVGRLTFSSLFIASGLVRLSRYLSDFHGPKLPTFTDEGRLRSSCLHSHALTMQMKLQSYEFETGGELMDNVAPKLDTAIETLTEHIPSLPFSYSDARVLSSPVSALSSGTLLSESEVHTHLDCTAGTTSMIGVCVVLTTSGNSTEISCTQTDAAILLTNSAGWIVP